MQLIREAGIKGLPLNRHYLFVARHQLGRIHAGPDLLDPIPSGINRRRRRPSLSVGGVDAGLYQISFNQVVRSLEEPSNGDKAGGLDLGDLVLTPKRMEQRRVLLIDNLNCVLCNLSTIVSRGLPFEDQVTVVTFNNDGFRSFRYSG